MLATGGLTSAALREVGQVRRSDARALLTEADLGDHNLLTAVAVLRGIAGAKSIRREMSPVWTMPGIEAEVGYLTGEFHRLLSAARVSVTCATYNFSSNSAMWSTLRDVSARTSVELRVYVDASKGRPTEVAAQLPGARVFASMSDAKGKPLVSHAKFVVIDHQMVLLTSANFPGQPRSATWNLDCSSMTPP